MDTFPFLLPSSGYFDLSETATTSAVYSLNTKFDVLSGSQLKVELLALRLCCSENILPAKLIQIVCHIHLKLCELLWQVINCEVTGS